MATEKVIQAHELIFKRLRNYKLYIPDNLNDEDLSEFFGNLVELNVTGKADKVDSATAGNFAGLDENGNLTDSGKSSSSFSTAGHLHDGRYPQKAGIETISALWTFNTTADQPAFAIGDNSAGVVIDGLNADLLDGKHGNEYALSGHTHSKYLECNPSTGEITKLVLWNPVAGEAPFTVHADMTATVTNLNADMLDDRHGSEYALSGHNHNSLYPLKAGIETIIGMWTFNTSAGGDTTPFTLHSSMTDVVTYLNADKLDGVEGAGYALAGHTHGDIYYTETEIDAMVALLLAKPTTGAADGTILVYDGAGVVQTSPSLYSELALVTDLATKYDEVAGVNDNFPAFATSGTTLVDSGFAAADFALAAHNHDDRYFTETEMGDKSTTIAVAQDSEVDDGAAGTYFIMGSNNANGAGVTPAGTLQVCVNGTIYYLLTSAAA